MCTYLSPADFDYVFTCTDGAVNGDCSIRFSDNTQLNSGFAGGTTFYINGTTTTATSVSVPLGFNVIGATPTTVSGLTRFGIGDTSTQTRYFYGYVKEVLVYSSLSTPQRQQVEQYLAWKWNLTTNLPSGHPGKLLPAFSTNFTVKSISGLQLWLDAADSSTITGTTSVTAWANKGTAGGSTSTTSGTVSSTSKINNLPVLSFSDSAYITAPSLTFTQGTRTAFVVVNIGASGISRVYLNDANSVGIQLYNYVDTSYTDIEFNRTGNVNYQKQNPSGIFNTTSIICGTLGTNGGIFVTGTSQAPYNLNNPLPFGTGTTTTQRVGGGGSYILGEAMIFDGAITDSQRQQVEGYLAWKWGLQSSLPSTHAYAKFAP